MANEAVSTKTPWWEKGPRYADWIVARGVLLNADARDAFARKGYPPGMFRCPIARGAVVWSLVNRKTIPPQLATAMLANHDGYESFIEFVEHPLVPEDGDADFGKDRDPVWEGIRAQREVREWAHRLYQVWLGKQR